MTDAAGAGLLSTVAPPAQAPTGLGFDPLMLLHQCECQVADNHPENPHRVRVIWEHLVNVKMADLCVRVGREATLDEIESVHSPDHILLYGTGGASRLARSKFSMLKCGGVGVDSDTYWNEAHTGNAARYAVGTVAELCMKVSIDNVFLSGFAVSTRPFTPLYCARNYQVQNLIGYN